MSRQEIERAMALEHQGRADESMSIYQGILRQQPCNADALYLLGLAHARRGETKSAVAYLQQARGLRPKDPSAAFNLGVAFLAEGTREKALDCFIDALRIDSGFIPAKVNLSALYLAQGRAAEALPLIDDIIARGKASASTWVNRGIALDLLHRPLEACTAFERASTIDGGDIQTLVYLGRAYAAAGDMERARAVFKRILDRSPLHVEALLRYATSQLEIVYRTEPEIEQSRANYQSAIEHAWRVATDAMAQIPLPHFQRMFDWPFFLPYQGEAVKEDLSRLGHHLRELAARWSPLASPPIVRSPRRDRLRLGIATAFFWRHSVWKVPTRGWLKSLDRARFEVVGYHLGTRTDEETGLAKTLCDRFHVGDHDLTDWARRIADDDLDCLLYPEIGMDRPTALLASMRLAPLQVTTWGHPVTSGLPTIDWYLSSDLMEPPDGDAHYAEKLIRLPNLSVFYDPVDRLPAAFDRAQFDIATDRIVYLCCQNLSKYLPRNDGVFIDIVKAVPAALFIFIQSGKPSVDARFEQRLLGLFTAAHLPFEAHVRFLAPLAPDAFPSLGGLGDVYLDSLEWSGCNTTLEMMASDLPIVTHGGRFMRGCHTAAMLRMMDLDGHIATTVDDYTARAIELGRDASLRKSWRADISQRKSRLFQDTSPIRQIETLLLRHFDRS